MYIFVKNSELEGDATVARETSKKPNGFWDAIDMELYRYVQERMTGIAKLQ